jgi:iron complex outermembrane receptor protein
MSVLDSRALRPDPGPANARRVSVRRLAPLVLWGSAGLLAVPSLVVPSLVLPGTAWAADTVDLGTVQATGNGAAGGATPAPIETAPYQAPTKAPLAATQPTSVISQQYIQNNIPLSSNYDEVVRLAPSVSSVSPNGPGLMENSNLSIRGLQDGQYNVTFDGIPWQDSNNFTHHTTSYFMTHDLGEASVDRGPGTASTVGLATFGGTLALSSKAPLSTMTLTPYGSVGSWDTHIYGSEFDTGAVQALGGASGFIDAEGLESNGYRTNSGQNRSNIFGKFSVPLGPNTVLTVVGMHNAVTQHVALGATRAQIAQFGPNVGLSNDPTQQNYTGYNVDHIQTDFEYVGIQSAFDGWTIDNKLYTYAYYHHGDNGLDLSGKTPNGTFYSPTDVPGQRMRMDYRSVGDVLNVRHDFAFGDIKTGLWVDRQSNSRQQYEVDWTQGGILNPPNSSSIDRLMSEDLTIVQPYLQVDWKATPRLTISPGLRYDYFGRSLDAQVNQGTKQPLDTSVDYGAALPSLAVHYALNKNWTAYAQVAKGYLAPEINYLYVKNPADSKVNPQETWNYQIGTAWQSPGVALSGDVYYIDFDNMISSVNIGNDTVYSNQGGVNYYGVEAEGTVYVADGFSLYANGSLNQARTKKGNQWVPNTPDATAAAGVIYNRNGIYGSLIDKWVGSRYGDTNQKQGLDPFNQLDLSVGYTLTGAPKRVPPVSIKLEVDNLLDSTGINYFSGYASDGKTPLYYTQPGRSFFLTASIPL